jgi:hypothetical protein
VLNKPTQVFELAGGDFSHCFGSRACMPFPLPFALAKLKKQRNQSAQDYDHGESQQILVS